MADLASSAVEVVNSWYSGLGKQIIHRRLRLTLTGQGTVANAIGATTLGFSKLEGASPVIEDDDSSVIVASPSYDGSQLLLRAADTNSPADYTGTFEVVVYGRI